MPGARARRASHRNDARGRRLAGPLVLLLLLTQPSSSLDGNYSSSHKPFSLCPGLEPPTAPVIVTGMEDSGTRGAWLAVSGLGVRTAHRDNGDNICFEGYQMTDPLFKALGRFAYDIDDVPDAVRKRVKTGLCAGLKRTWADVSRNKKCAKTTTYMTSLVRTISKGSPAAVAASTSSVVWGWKGPKALHYLPFWKWLLGPDIKVVFVLRDGRDRVRPAFNNNGCRSFFNQARLEGKQAKRFDKVKWHEHPDNRPWTDESDLNNPVAPFIDSKHKLAKNPEQCPPQRAVGYWNWVTLATLRWAEENLPHQFHVLRIEDLVLAPNVAHRAATLRKLEAFLLGLDDPRIPPEAKSRVQRATNRTVTDLGAQFEGHAPNYNGLFYRYMSPRDQAALVATGREALERFGYGDFLSLDEYAPPKVPLPVF